MAQDASSPSWLKPPHHHRFNGIYARALYPSAYIDCVSKYNTQENNHCDGALSETPTSEGSGALKSLSRFPFSTVDTCQHLGASGLKNLSVYAKSSVAKAPGK